MNLGWDGMGWDVIGCEKYGAGLLFCCEREVLLLKRSPKSGNPLTWGLPGGNVDATDETLLFTAERESIEEMEKLPKNYKVIKEVTTRRGKRMQKWYKVFVASISKEEKDTFEPVLNNEHVEYKWIDVSLLQGMHDKLHPVVRLVFASNGELPLKEFEKLLTATTA